MFTGGEQLFLHLLLPKPETRRLRSLIITCRPIQPESDDCIARQLL